MKRIAFALAVTSSVLLAKPTVSTTILPTKYFVEKIAADTVDVNVMVGKGSDPHTYEPKPSQMKNVEKSDLYFAVGLEFDALWLKKFASSYPNMKIIHTQDGIEKIKMTKHSHHDHEGHEHHDHHEHEAHHEERQDPHIWLDPILAKIQAKNIKEALTKQYPKNAKLYEENFIKFAKELDDLDGYAKDKLKNIKNKKFMVYHPSWGYFAHRYGLEQLPVEVEGKEPKPGDLAELIEEAKEENIKVIFVAPQFSQKAAKTIAAQTGAKVMEIDQLPENWSEVMKQTIDTFSRNL